MGDSRNAPQTYAKVEHCIYCGTREGKPTKEHIIPYGLGGNLVLPSASCSRCATITGEVERFCLRTMMKPLRAQMKLPSRSALPEALPVEFIRLDGTREQEEIATNEAPASCIGFRWPAPGLLRDVPPIDDFEGEAVFRIGDSTKLHLQPEGQKVKVASFRMLDFARMLAKIAHSFAVATLGSDHFDPLLPDLILGKSTTAPFFIGGDKSGAAVEFEPDLLHEMYYLYCKHRDTTYVLVAIRLFAMFGMPRYHVVVGPARKPVPVP